MNKLNLQDQITESWPYTLPNGKVRVVCSIMEHTNEHGTPQSDPLLDK